MSEINSILKQEKLEEKIAKIKERLINGLTRKEYNKKYYAANPKNYYRLKKAKLAAGRFQREYGKKLSKNPKVAQKEMEQFQIMDKRKLSHLIRKGRLKENKEMSEIEQDLTPEEQEKEDNENIEIPGQEKKEESPEEISEDSLPA